MDDRGGEFDMPHPLPSHPTVGNLYTTAIANHPLVLHPPVFSAGAFPVLFRPENFLTEKAIFFRFVGTIINRLRFLDLSKRPTTNIVRPSQTDFYRRIIVDTVVRAFANAHLPDLLHSRIFCKRSPFFHRSQ